MSTDERKGLPSASSAFEDQCCRARFRMQRDWLEATQEEVNERDDELFGQSESHERDDSIDSDAESGRRIHKLYANQECPEATESEIRRAKMAHEVDAKMLRKWLERFDGDGLGVAEEIRERRFWLMNDDGEPIYSGQADAVWIRGVQGDPCDILVGDLKGLWGQHDPSRINVQIRRYIALIAATIADLGFTEVRSAACYLNQPAVTLDPQLTVYSSDDIQEAVTEMYMEIMAISDPDSEPTPHPRACHHCKAKLSCTPYLSELAQLPAVIAPGSEPPSKDEIKAKLAALPGDRLALLLPWAKSVSDLEELAGTEARRRLRADPESVPGYRLKPNVDRSKITDVKTIWQRMSKQYPVSPDDFMAKVGITKVAIQEILKTVSPLRGQGLDAEVSRLVEGATNPIKVSPSLEKI